jgi:hypothetical protein
MVETKVTSATLVSLFASVALSVITAFLAEPGAFGPLSAPVAFVLMAALPPIATFLGGYAAPHTPRETTQQGV